VFNNGPRALSRTVPASGRQLRYTCGMGHLLGYGRVSAAEQNAELQTDEPTMAGCWRLAVPDVTFSGGAGSVLQHDLAQRALLVTEEAEHACGKPLGVGERGRCPLHPGGVHHLQRAARRIRCLRHRDRGVVRVGEAGVMLRHLDGELRQAPLSVLAPNPLDRLGTGRRLASDDAAP
jgi:hypothetical protein